MASTHLQDCSNGFSLVAASAISEGELVYINTSGQAALPGDADHFCVAVALADVASGATGTFLPLIPGRQYWVKAQEAIVVGDVLTIDLTGAVEAGTVVGTAVGATLVAGRIGVALTATAGEGLVRVLCSFRS